jgi:hypothetical protein
MDSSAIKSVLIQPSVQTLAQADSFAAPSLEIKNSVHHNGVSSSTCPDSLILRVMDTVPEPGVVSLGTTPIVKESDIIVIEEPCNSDDGKPSLHTPLIFNQSPEIPEGSTVVAENDDSSDEKKLRRMGFFIFFFISCPFIICNLYFATTDESCVHQATSDFNLPYSTILIVDAVLNIALLLGIVVIRDKYLGMFLFVMYQIFVFIWTIISCIVFFSFMDVGKDCSRPVYTYILTTLILKLIGQLNLICQSPKKD